MAAIGLPELVAAVIVLALNAYALMGGADFGGGVWDLLASGPRRERQRELIATTIAPIWEANHVWLIVVVVVLFTAFPPAFATLSVVLHLPLTLLLVGIVMRGSAFVFRAYGSRTRDDRRRWGRAFAIASTVTPLVLGDVIGALSSGAVADAAAHVGHAPFVEVFVAPWLAPFPLAVGALALALFAFLAAVYLTLAADDEEVREDFRRRALASAVAVFVTAFGALVIARATGTAPRMAGMLTASRFGLAVQLGTGVAAVTAIAALWRRQYRRARTAAAAQLSLILWGWALAQYPFVIPPLMKIRDAAAPEVTLRLLLWGLAGGAVVLVPALGYLFRTFRVTARG